MSVKIAVVGASGLVGRTFLKVLEENCLEGEYTLFSSYKSEGKTIVFRGKEYPFIRLTENCLKDEKFDYALFSAGSFASEKFAPLFTRNGTVVIDNSSFFRRKKEVPLVCFGVNETDALKNYGIIANPNCSTIEAVNVLKPIHDAYSIKRVIFTTMQSVSGAGKRGIDALNMQNLYKSGVFPYTIYSNCIPQIGEFTEGGYTEEEDKLVFETQKILHDKSIKITATAVRVPVFYGHSICVNVETQKPFDIDELYSVLRKNPRVITFEDPLFPTTLDAINSDCIFVGRIRRDFSAENAVNLWIVANNLRRGAATNAVEILKYLIENRKKDE